MISLTEYSLSFNIPTSSYTCWVLVGCLLGACWITIYQLQVNTITIISTFLLEVTFFEIS